MMEENQLETLVCRCGRGNLENNSVLTRSKIRMGKSGTVLLMVVFVQKNKLSHPFTLAQDNDIAKGSGIQY